MPRRILRPLPALALGLSALLLALPASAAKVYQWKDANGVTHYSDEPPPGQQGYQDREVDDGPPPPAPTATKPAEDPNCTTARANLEHLKSDKPVGLDANRDGKPDQEMTAEDRAKQVDRAEWAIKNYCKSAAST